MSHKTIFNLLQTTWDTMKRQHVKRLVIGTQKSIEGNTQSLCVSWFCTEMVTCCFKEKRNGLSMKPFYWITTSTSNFGALDEQRQITNEITFECTYLDVCKNWGYVGRNPWIKFTTKLFLEFKFILIALVSPW